MFGFGKRDEPSVDGPRVSTKFCTDKFNGKYPHVGLFDCRERKVWVCKPLAGQAIRTSHARLITGADNATSTVWKDRFLCFWFYTPDTGEGYIHGYPIDWQEGHLLVRIACPDKGLATHTFRSRQSYRPTWGYLPLNLSVQNLGLTRGPAGGSSRLRKPNMRQILDPVHQ